MATMLSPRWRTIHRIEFADASDGDDWTLDGKEGAMTDDAPALAAAWSRAVERARQLQGDGWPRVRIVTVEEDEEDTASFLQRCRVQSAAAEFFDLDERFARRPTDATIALLRGRSLARLARAFGARDLPYADDEPSIIQSVPGAFLTLLARPDYAVPRRIDRASHAVYRTWVGEARYLAFVGDEAACRDYVATRGGAWTERAV